MSIIQKKTLQLHAAVISNASSLPFEMIDTPNPLNVFITGTLGGGSVVIESEAPNGKWVPVGGIGSRFLTEGLFTMKLVTDVKLRATIMDADSTTVVSVFVQGLIV